MISHHPDIDLLLEYSAGGSPFPLAMLLHMHLQHCPSCRHSLRKLEIIGGEFFSASPQGQVDPVDEHAFDRVMSLIEAEESADADASAAGVENTYFRKNFPLTYGAGSSVSSLALEKLLPKRFSTIDWKRRWLGVFEHVIATGGDKPAGHQGAEEPGQQWKLALQRIRKGASAPRHVHSNCEYTVVLQGGFSDKNGVYREGDFVVHNHDSAHRPRAMEDQDCICLAFIQGKIGLFNPLAGRLLRFRQRLS